MADIKDKYILLGYRKGKGKDSGKEFVMIHVARPFPEKWEGCVGSFEETHFIPKKFFPLITPEVIGSEIVLKMGCNQDTKQWYLWDIQIVK